MINRNSNIIKSTYILLAVIPFLIASYYYSLNEIITTYYLTAEIHALHSDTLQIYPPDKNGKYTEATAVEVTYNQGSQKLTIPVRISYNSPLRIDPGTQKQKLTIEGLKLSRTAKSDGGGSNLLATNRINPVDITLANNEDSLHIITTSEDPQLYFIDYPLPNLFDLWPYFFTTLAATILYIFFAINLFKKGTIKRCWGRLLAILIVLVLSSFVDLPFILSLFLSYIFSTVLLLNLYATIKSGIGTPTITATYNFIILVLFLAIISFPLYSLAKSNSINVIFSKISTHLASQEYNNHTAWLTDLIQNVEEQFNYRFPSKKTLIHNNANFKIKTLGYSPSSKAIIGEDGFFFEGYGQRRVESDVVGSFDNITDYIGLIPFTLTELEKWKTCLEERYFWLKERGIDYIFALAPTKALIYPEYLPDRLRKFKDKTDKMSRYDQLIDYLHNHSVVPIVDLRAPLLAAKKEISANKETRDLFLYYKTDFHWNFLGSLYAYQAIAEKINKNYPHYNMTPSTIDDFTLKRRTNWVHARFMNMMGLDPLKNQNETYLTLIPNPGSDYSAIEEFSTSGINDYSLPERTVKEFGSTKIRVIKLTNANGEMPLIYSLGDSFSEKYIGYLAKHAKQTIGIRTVYQFPLEVFKTTSPDLVIQEVLSMYLLQPPPTNPPALKEAYARAMPR